MRWLAPAVLLVGVLQARGEPGPPPREVSPAARIQYLGRKGYEPEGGRDPLILRMEADGRVIADKPVEITDDDLGKIVTRYCEGHTTASIVVGVMQPDKTTLRSISKTIERINKRVPAKTIVTFLIQNYD